MATIPFTISKYQDKVDPWSSHVVLRNRLSHLAPETRILDVGTATGMLGRMCQGYALQLHGLEPDPIWAEIASPFYRSMTVSTVENASDDALRGFDVIVCADVLEHLPNPDATLLRLVKLQSEKAVFLVSIPNIANIWVRLSLLFGHFEYAERGILDRTHLRFFTRRTFTQMLANAGLSIVTMQVTPIPLGLINPYFIRSPAGRLIYRLLAALTRMLPTLLGYQFVAETVKT